MNTCPSPTRSGPLSGLKVLEFAGIGPGPFCGMLLADMGAEVTLLERAGGTFASQLFGGGRKAVANRGKKSVTIDMGSPDGQALIRDLAARCDVVLENFKVGGLAAYGLDYAALKAVNPKLIYCSITGFGQDGPYAKRAGYDFMIQGLGGLMSLTGRPEGEEGAGPMKVGVALTDILTGLYATVGVLAALNHREQTGIGQHVDLALLDVQVACLANQAMNFLTSGVPPRRLGNAHPNIVPYQDFPSADGDFLLAVGNDSQFRKFCEVAGQREWADDSRFISNKARVANRDVLIPLIRQATVFKTTAEWIAALEQAGVPCGPINNLAEVFADAQVQARGLRIDMPNSLGGTTPQVASPLRLSATPVEYRNAPPLLGEHTDTVLQRLLQLSTEQVAALRRAGVL